MEKLYYDIRVKNKDGTEDFLIILKVHEDLVDTYVSRESMNEIYKNKIVYKQKSVIE